ncbi:related to Rab proteins geranylgeranyltransferase component A [Saccharomycodes ludwigii]|uniref:Rab proteins geranylgeranyltransferase component A n=1 Tax=Saccharomycodes ludwigii TaxID=36035 RepID=A0A376B9U7_9ASCO|nr:related to Rab proteins geranylgeranyltransferase component A [Saccharomycodes ludwigii]
MAVVKERRASMAERKPSFIGKESPMIIPHLAGMEDPLPEKTPEEVDVVIVGTGLIQSILAAALSWQGSHVLHIDKNEYYGDTTPTLTIEQLTQWVRNVNKGLIPFYTNAQIYVSSDKIGKNYASRDFGIDLVPKVLFAQSDMLTLLVKSRVYQYMEFMPLSNFHTFENDSFEKLTNTKQEIFTDQTIPLMTKRNLMRFLKFVLNWENYPEIWEGYSNKSMAEFLSEKFKLNQTQSSELIFSIGLCYNNDVATPQCLQRIRRYLASFDIYGAFPVLFSKYGSAGEISQGFCRSAAVGGATYKLNTALESYDPTTKIVKFSDGSKVHVSERVVVSPTQTPDPKSKNIPKQNYKIHRLVVAIEKDCKQWFGEQESATVVVFPPGSLNGENFEAVQAIIFGSNSEICPQGTNLWYLTSVEKGENGKRLLDLALKTMLKSISRESIEVDDNVVKFDNKTGSPVINEKYLKEELNELVEPKILMKCYFEQYTSTCPFSIAQPEIFKTQKKDTTDDTTNGNKDNGVIYSPMPSSEISYDGAITAAKVLYETIVGSDDDFFDVDFEDEDITTTNNNRMSYSESAITDDEGEEDDIIMKN